MNKNQEYVLTSSQVMSLITSTIIGVQVLTLPRTITEVAHQSGWISVLIGGMVSLFGMGIILILGKRYPGYNLISISQEVLGVKKNQTVGRVMAFPLLATFILYWLISTAMIARTFGELVVTAVLIKTPLEVIVLSMLLVALTMVLYDLEVMARVNEVLLPIIIIPVLFIALLSFQSADFIRLLPLIAVDWKGLLQGVLIGSLAYQGFEMMALYLGNMNVLNKETNRAAYFGIMFPMLIYTLIVVAGISAFGYEELQRLMWPTLELVKTTEMPGLILERLESAFLGVWVAAVFTSVANLYFSACYLSMKVFRLKSHRWFAVGVFPILYYTAMWPENVLQLFNLLEYLSYIALALGFVSPLFLLFFAIIRKKGNQEKQGGKQA